MKPLCRQTDITDWRTVLPWVRDCITRNKHWQRRDFRRLLYDHGLSGEAYNAAFCTHDYGPWEPAFENIAKEAAQGIYERDLDLTPPTIKTRFDVASQKTREIGCECAMQQVYDFIAVGASMPVFERRMVPQQASSVKGRGQVYGMRMIRRWAIKSRAGTEYAERHGYRPRNPMRYKVKTDVAQCFPSCRMERFLAQFEKDCGNPDIVWLWRTLFLTHRIDDKHQGFMIGALTSQWAAQYMLSFAYQHVMNLKGRDGKPLVTHMLIFMDDMLMTGPSRRSLMRAAESLTGYMFRTFGLSIKPGWSVTAFTERDGIDMMSYVVYPSGKVVIRGRDWVKIRRMMLRAIDSDYQVSYKQAKRLTSYKGYLKHSDSKNTRARYKALPLFRAAQDVVSITERNGEKSDNDLRK